MQGIKIRSQIEVTPALNDYLIKYSLRDNEIFSELRRVTKLDSHSVMQITPLQAQFLGLIVKMIGAVRTIDIGTYTGYSSLAVALAMGNGSYTLTCDINHSWTNIAKKFWEKAKVDNKIELKLKLAEDTLKELIINGQTETYDFIFIDADKINYNKYYELSMKLLRKGGIIAMDNTLLYGTVVLENVKQEDLKKTISLTVDDVNAIKKLNGILLKDDRIDFSMLPFGDGLSIIRKR